MPIDSLTISTSDSEEADQILEQTYRPERPLSGHRSVGDFRFSFAGREAGELHAARIQHTGFDASDLPPVTDLVVTAVLDGQLWCGSGGARPVHAGRGDVVLYPRAQHSEIGCDDADLAVIRLPMETVERVATEEFGPRGTPFAFLDPEPVSPAARAGWVSLSQVVLAQLAAPDTLLAEPLARDRLIELLARSVLTSFPHSHADSQPYAGGAVGQRTLRRATWFIEENSEERITLSDVAGAVGAEPAAVRRAFRKAYGLTPMRYLDRIRLEAAHRELELGGVDDSEDESDIAARAGFPSVALFVAAYARRFGVEPATVLKRARSSW